MSSKLPSLAAMSALVSDLIPDIKDDYRASEDADDDMPGMCLTVGWDGDPGDWGYQTGDNSYTGGAYGYRHWAVVSLYRDSSPGDVAREIRDQLADLAADDSGDDSIGPDEDDAYVTQCRGGYSASVDRKRLGTYPTADEAYAAIRAHCGPDYHPQYWYVNERGNTDGTDDHGNVTGPSYV